MNDFIYTLDSEPESEAENVVNGSPQAGTAATNDDDATTTNAGSSQTAELKVKPTRKKTSSSKKRKVDEDDDGEDDNGGAAGALVIDPEFNFDLGGGSFFDGLGDGADTWGLAISEDVVHSGTKPAPISVDDIIERRRRENPTLKKLSAKQLKRKREADAMSVEEDVISNDDEMVLDDDTAEISGSDAEGFGKGASDEEDEESEDDHDPLATSDEESQNQVESDDENEDDEDAAASEDDDARSDASLSSASSTASQKAAKDAFFAPNPVAVTKSKKSSGADNSFASLNLSRPLIRALTAMSFSSPTPIQARTIPLALAGQDVLGSAVTGSGKTLAFLIPTLERLMYREKKSGKNGRGGEIRVLVLVPTRELAVQCADVGKSLARFTDVTFGVIVGGLSSKAQEATLRARPDVLIATPGRLIDHLQNTHSFSLSALDVLILDEADRMLSDGFAAELTEIIKACPSSGGGSDGSGGSGRQTMLFSATMSDEVDRLVQLSMQRPVRLFVDPKKTLARGLTQEFVRIKRENERQAILLTLCVRTAKRGVIVFLRSKKLAHQMRVVFGLLSLRAVELHGDLTQEQRLGALKSFRAGDADYLLATDVASRGLDIKGIETVINYDMPGQIELYLHRVGRTARAGEVGRAISLVGEADRTMLKAVIKRSSHSKDDDESIRHRLVPDDAVKAMHARLESIKEEISEVLREEKEEKEIRRGEMEVTKGQNMIEHEAEIFSRPKKTWFTTSKEKAAAENLSKQQYEAGFTAEKKSKGNAAAEGPAPKRDKFSGLSRKLKRRKMAADADKEFNDAGAMASAIRAAKKSGRPKPIGEDEPSKSGKPKRKDGKAGKKPGHSSAKKRVLGKDSKFSSEMGARRGAGGAASEGIRAKKGDGGILGGKKAGKGKGKSGGGKPKGRR